MIRTIFRTDPTNVGDWYCAPSRYFADLGDDPPSDIRAPVVADGDAVVLGGGGLVSVNFAADMARLAAMRDRLSWLIAWGIGESLDNDKSGGLVPPWRGALPDYLDRFDLVGLRDFGLHGSGVVHEWAPCASCMLPHFDRRYAVRHPIVLYEHKRIPIPIEGLPRRSNAGRDIDAALAFLASGEVVITNSYHGAYWATLLGRRVIAIPNLSKMHHFRHPPVICAADAWTRHVDRTVRYPEALAQCRDATEAFHARVRALLAAA